MSATDDFAAFRERRDRERAEAEAARISWRAVVLPDGRKGYVARRAEFRAYATRTPDGVWEYGKLVGRTAEAVGVERLLGNAQVAAFALVEAQSEGA